MTLSKKGSGFGCIDWGKGTKLFGNGPGYLLFSPKGVLDLRTGPGTQIAPELKRVLKGFQAIDAKTGEIIKLASDLSRIYGGINFGGSSESKNNVPEAIGQIMTSEPEQLQKAVRYFITHRDNNFGGSDDPQNNVLEAISRIMRAEPGKLEKEVNRFSTLLKAAWNLRQWAKLDFGFMRAEPEVCKLWFYAKDGTPLTVTDFDFGEDGRPGSLLSFREYEWSELARNIRRNPMRIKRNPNPTPTPDECRHYLQPATFYVQTPATSDFARLAQQRMRVPTKKELRDDLEKDEPTITRRCRQAGFSWLPTEIAGRKSLQHRGSRSH